MFTDGFWTMVGVVLPVLIVQIFQYLATRKNAKASEKGREDIKAQVCEVRDQIDTIKLTKDEIDTIMKGRERQLVSMGIEEGKRQATSPMPLSGK